MRILSQETQPVGDEIGVELRFGPSAHAPRSPRGSPAVPPPTPQEARSRLSEVFPGLRNERQGPPLRREPPKRTYTGPRASGDPPHSGILTAATTSARAANPLLRSPNGRSTPVKPHAPERAPPSSASRCLSPANRKSRRVAAPPPCAYNGPMETQAAFVSRPFTVSWVVGG